MVCTAKLGVAEEIVEYLIDNGASIKFNNYEYSNIIDFAMSRDEDFAKYLQQLLKKKNKYV